MPDQATDGQACEFAAAFRGFLEWIHSPAAGVGEGNEVAAALGGTVDVVARVGDWTVRSPER
jgi:hypothetical protein